MYIVLAFPVVIFGYGGYGDSYGCGYDNGGGGGNFDYLGNYKAAKYPYMI